MEYIRYAVATALGTISAFFVSLPTAVWLLCGLMVADYVTGILVAISKGKLSSKTGRDGLIKKVLTLILVLVSHAITHVQELGFDVGSGIAIFFCVNELVSITENCARGGVSIPPVLLSAIEKVESLTGAWNGPERRTRSIPVDNELRKRT